MQPALRRTNSEAATSYRLPCQINRLTRLPSVYEMDLPVILENKDLTPMDDIEEKIQKLLHQSRLKMIYDHSPRNEFFTDHRRNKHDQARANNQTPQDSRKKFFFSSRDHMAAQNSKIETRSRRSQASFIQDQTDRQTDSYGNLSLQQETFAIDLQSIKGGNSSTMTKNSMKEKSPSECKNTGKDISTKKRFNAFGSTRHLLRKSVLLKTEFKPPKINIERTDHLKRLPLIHNKIKPTRSYPVSNSEKENKMNTNAKLVRPSQPSQPRPAKSFIFNEPNKNSHTGTQDYTLSEKNLNWLIPDNDDDDDETIKTRNQYRITKWLNDVEQYNRGSSPTRSSLLDVQEDPDTVPCDSEIDYDLSEFGSNDEQFMEYNRIIDKTYCFISNE